MANGDVKVKEIQLLELYYDSYDRFMYSTKHLMYRFNSLFYQKEREAEHLARMISDHLNIAQQKYVHAKVDYEGALNKSGGPDKDEVMYRQQAFEMYKHIYEKATMYAELAKNLYQNIHRELDRVNQLTTLNLFKLEDSNEYGKSFLKKAITALKEYSQ